MEHSKQKAFHPHKKYWLMRTQITLVEHDSFIAVTKNPMLQVPAEGAGEDDAHGRIKSRILRLLRTQDGRHYGAGRRVETTLDSAGVAACATSLAISRKRGQRLPFSVRMYSAWPRGRGRRLY